MKALLRYPFFVLLPMLLGGVGCVGVQTFTPAARQGDTVALAVGWQQNLQRKNVTVTITDAANVVTTYGPNDSHVRSIVNMYPDPSSAAVVGTMTNQSLGYGGNNTGNLINTFVTGGDREWWQTTMMLDLPATMATGNATINVVDSQGALIEPISIYIVPGTGSSNIFNAYWNGGANQAPLLQWWPQMLHSMEPSARYTVNINTYTDTNGNLVFPHSVQMTFTHIPNVGKTWVVNPRGDIKNVIWRDDGTNITVILTPTQGKTLTLLSDYRFYISGGITGLTETGLSAYDVSGNLMSGVTATIQ